MTPKETYDTMKKTVPEFWKSTNSEVDRYMTEHVVKGQHTCLCTSAGNRPVGSVTYGPPSRGRGRTNFSAGSGSGDISCFYGDKKSDAPVIMIVGCTHGAEMEGTMGLVNLLHLLETGHDLEGDRHPELERLSGKTRLVLVPMLNPDGRARITPDSLVGEECRDMFRYWAQGQWKNGELIGYPECKRYQPLPLEKVEFPGGYPNDDGINLMHDVALSGPRSAEVRSLFRLVESERPDCVLLLHSHETGPCILSSDPLLPSRHQELQQSIIESVYNRLKERELRPEPGSLNPGKRNPLFNMATAMYATAGSLPLVFEGPHGLGTCPFTHEEILDIYLTTFETVLKAVHEIPVDVRSMNGQ